jgi:hypothetical protein
MAALLRRLLQPGLTTESWVSTGADAVRQGLGSALTRLSIRVELDNKTAQDEVQEALAICGCDAIAALRITLIANAFLLVIFKRHRPNIQIDEFHEEREHIPDRRHLNAVTVRLRYTQS